MVVTFEEALAEREARGEERGLTEGKIQAVQEAVLRSAEARVGPVSADVQEKVREIHNLEHLYDVLLRLFTITSLDELDLALSC